MNYRILFFVSIFIFISLSIFSLSFIGAEWPHLPAPSVITELRCDEGSGTTAAD